MDIKSLYFNESKMNNVSFRKAKIGDISKITNLFRNTINSVNSKHYSPQEIKAWSDGADNIDNWRLRIDTHHFTLAEINAQLAGMMSITSSGYLDVIYVHEDYQGKGIASSLLNKAEQYALAQGHAQITSDVSITAKPFFLHKGFEIIRPQLVLCRGVVLRNYTVSKQIKK